MQSSEWTEFRHNSQLDLGFLSAYHVRHAYPRHSHDYFVISLIEQGFQSFTHKADKYRTPPGGIIFINPDVVHTGEAVDANGFLLRSLYPSLALMERIAFELTGRHQGLPFFKQVRVDDAHARKMILSLHKALFSTADALEQESRLTWTLAGLIKQYADILYSEPKFGKESNAVQKACQYIEENFANGVRLTELAQHVALSPYYLLRVFRSEVGMPPYAYLENVRVRYAQRLLEVGTSLMEAALDAGYSSQSQMTLHFKRILGVTPGQYARSMKV